MADDSTGVISGSTTQHSGRSVLLSSAMAEGFTCRFHELPLSTPPHEEHGNLARLSLSQSRGLEKEALPTLAVDLPQEWWTEM